MPLTSPRHQTKKLIYFKFAFIPRLRLFFNLVSDVILLLLMLLLLLYGLWPLTSGFWPLAILILSIVASGLWLLASGLGMGVYPCRSRSTLCVGRGSIHDRPWIDTGTSRSTLVNNGLTSIEPLKNCMPSQLCIELWFWLWLWLVARTYSADDLCEHRFADPERVPTIQSYKILVGG